LPSLGLGSSGGIPISLRASEAKEDTTEALGDISEKIGGMIMGQSNTPGNIGGITEGTLRTALLPRRNTIE